MKAGILVIIQLLVSVSAFAQGKITLGNDSLHLIYATWVLPTPTEPDVYPVPQNGGWMNLTMQLYAGTSAGSMTLQTTIVGDAIGDPARPDGRIANRSVTLSGIGTSTSAYLQIVFFSTAAGSYSNAVSGLWAHTETPVFTVTTGSFAYNSIVLHGAPGFSTWPDTPVPEPSVAGLAGVGILLMFRCGWRIRCAKRNRVRPQGRSLE